MYKDRECNFLFLLKSGFYIRALHILNFGELSWCYVLMLIWLKLHCTIQRSKLKISKVLFFFFPIFPHYLQQARTGFLYFIPYPWVSCPPSLYLPYIAKLIPESTRFDLEGRSSIFLWNFISLTKLHGFTTQGTTVLTITVVKIYKNMGFTKPGAVLQICGFIEADADRFITGLRFFFSSARDKGSQGLVILNVSS
jgi:hypothetical protein